MDKQQQQQPNITNGGTTSTTTTGTGQTKAPMVDNYRANNIAKARAAKKRTITEVDLVITPEDRNEQVNPTEDTDEEEHDEPPPQTRRPSKRRKVDHEPSLITKVGGSVLIGVLAAVAAMIKNKLKHTEAEKESVVETENKFDLFY